MASASAQQGLRQRPSVSPMEHKPPRADATGELQPAVEKIAKEEQQDVHQEGEQAHGKVLQGVRAVGLALFFLVCCISMHLTQWIGVPLYFIDRRWYYAWMAMIKAHFGLLLVTLQHWWSPTLIHVNGDRSVRPLLRKLPDGRLECDFPERMVLIANHVIYTDWLYLWWVAYTSHMHGHIYIILKESIRFVPILGVGMMLFSFIFLSRNWTNDRVRFAERLRKLKRREKGDDGAYRPMWLLIFPEGTNLCDNGRKRSAAWAAKQGYPDLQHTLLPRSTGLNLCLEELDDTVEWIYDCTLAYEGVPRGEYGQDIYSLDAMYLKGRGPKSVNMYWRRFATSEIPRDSKAFGDWLLERWREKDALLEHYMTHGRFPVDEDAVVETKETPNGAAGAKAPQAEGIIDTSVRPQFAWEFLQLFAPILAIVLLLGLTKRWWNWLLIALAVRKKSSAAEVEGSQV